MGAGLSSTLFTADELALLTDLSGDATWPLDSEKWHTLLRFKTFLWTADAAVVTAEVGAFAARLLAADAKTHNFATFAAHVASRLPSVFYFHRTDIEMTTAGVVRRRAAAAAAAASAQRRAPTPPPPSPSHPATPPPAPDHSARLCAARAQHVGPRGAL